MNGANDHTHRLIMQRPGVFLCVYCGRCFEASADSGQTAPALGSAAWGVRPPRVSHLR